MLHVILLAGGRSQRMLSDLPKVLHPIGGKPLLMHLIESVFKLQPDTVSIVYSNELVPQALSAVSAVQWVLQKSPLGTGHAVAQVLPHLKENARVLILPGDTPLITPTTLEAFMQSVSCDAIGLATQKVPSPKGLGRIVREAQQILGIVEEKDATSPQKQINEVNLGLYLISAVFLKRWIPQLNNHNAQKEYYLTDIIKRAQEENIPITSFSPDSLEEVQGINTRYQLSLAEEVYQSRQTRSLLEAGLGIKDRKNFWLYGDLQFGKDVVIHPHVTLEGHIVLKDRVNIGPYTHLKDVTIEADSHIEGFCMIQDTKTQKGVKIGPFAHIHNNVELMEKSVIGNFVEITRSQIGPSSKIKHLSYMGDVLMEERVNVGAGTISCNYDGLQKHQTRIEKEAHIGAHTSIIAPSTIGAGATIGAGSVITKNAPSYQLTLSRTPQVTVENWKRPSFKKKNP